MLFYLVIQNIPIVIYFFFFNDTATTEIYTLSLHDALPICFDANQRAIGRDDRHIQAVNLAEFRGLGIRQDLQRSEEHTSELQSRLHLVCRLLLEKKKKTKLAKFTSYTLLY